MLGFLTGAAELALPASAVVTDKNATHVGSRERIGGDSAWLHFWGRVFPSQRFKKWFKLPVP